MTHSQIDYQMNVPDREPFDKSTNSRSSLKRKAQENMTEGTNQPKQLKKTTDYNETNEFSESSFASPMNTKKKTSGLISYFKGFWSKKEEPESIKRKVIPINEYLLNYAFIIEQKCLDLGLTCVIYQKVIVVSGESRKVKVLEDFLEQNKSDLSNSVCQQLNTINIEKELTLSPFLNSVKDQLSKKAQEFALSCTFDDNKLAISGPHESINNMLTYLVELEALPARGKFERREFEEILTNELEASRFVNDNLNDLKRQIDTLESTIKTNIHEATEKESIVMHEMHDSLNRLKIDFQELEKKDFYPKFQVEESLRINKDIQADLDRMKEQIDQLAAKISSNSEECFQKESVLFISMNESLAQMKKKIEMFEIAMELNFQEAMKEGTKLSTTVLENVTEVGKKVELLHVGVDAHVEKLLTINERFNTTTSNTLEKLNKKVDALQKKVEQAESEKQVEQVSMFEIDKKMAEFLRNLDKKLKEDSSRQNPSGKEASNDDDIEEYIQKEIGVSPFQRDCLKDIIKKAKEYGLICDFGYDVILATGYEKSLERFMVYLHEIEFTVKKSLYPKYWNFHEANPFSLVGVAANSEEYQNIGRLFSSTMQNHRIIKLERIQNKYLMEHYAINVQKRKEFRPEEPINRQLLFYGTSAVKPESIYGNFDVGFDLQYADDKGYGKGIAFAVNASYSHSRHGHKTPEGNFKLLVADVFVGKSKLCAPGTYYKPPEGYDSISANGVFYMIYNNFHSYPLYQIEYR